MKRENFDLDHIATVGMLVSLWALSLWLNANGHALAGIVLFGSLWVALRVRIARKSRRQANRSAE